MSPVFIKLPMPDKRLSVNARVHWRTRARLTNGTKKNPSKGAREVARLRCIECHQQDLGLWVPILPTITEIHYEIIRYANRRMDDDNVMSTCKAYRDGIADALGIDDSIMRIRGIEHVTVPPKPKPGCAGPMIVFKLWIPETNK